MPFPSTDPSLSVWQSFGDSTTVSHSGSVDLLPSHLSRFYGLVYICVDPRELAFIQSGVSIVLPVLSFRLGKP